MIKLYVTDSCGKCKILKKKLDDKEIEYEVEDNVDTVMAKAKEIGVSTVPIIYKDGKLVGFTEMMQWVNKK